MTDVFGFNSLEVLKALYAAFQYGLFFSFFIAFIRFVFFGIVERKD